jgi:Family of unknown function (DUF6951)
VTEVEIKAGACGFTTRVRAEKNDNKSVSLRIDSDCESVIKMAEELGEAGWDDLFYKRFARGPASEIASRTLAHPSCPVLSGILKCTEAELGLALPTGASIEFKDSDE